MRLMGLDVGNKTIGVAVSDPMGWTAQGIEVIRRKNLQHDFAKLNDLIEKYEVEKVIVGMPRNMNGTLGPQSEVVRDFIDAFTERFAVPVETWDERLTTVAAEKMLIEADVSRAKRKKVIDKMAAVMILQGYLDRAAGRHKAEE